MAALNVAELRESALVAGADAFGVTSAAPFAEARHTLESRKDAGLAGPLHFTYDDPETASDVKRTHPWAESIVVVGCNYLPRTGTPSETGATVARFATRDHYERVRRVTGTLIDKLESAGARASALIDDNRLLDRAAAARAGLGWMGKSTMILSPGHGPWLLFGSVATDLRLEPSEPMRRTCGTCVACIPACPTGAITSGGLDGGKCISTWLQTSGPIPFWVRPLIERRIYGCDDCLTSCPPGFPAMGRIAVREPELSFAELLAASDDELLDRFGHWYVPGREARFIRRNLLVAAGNSQEESAVEGIFGHFGHRSSLVRGHAYWALARSIGIDGWATLRAAYDGETVPDARRELENAVLMLRVPTGG